MRRRVVRKKRRSTKAGRLVDPATVAGAMVGGQKRLTRANVMLAEYAKENRELRGVYQGVTRLLRDLNDLIADFKSLSKDVGPLS